MIQNKPISKIHKRFCPQGHDTFVVGRRIGNAQCRQCHRDIDNRLTRTLKRTIALELNDRRRRLRLLEAKMVMKGMSPITSNEIFSEVL